MTTEPARLEPKSDLSSAELISRATALVPLLRRNGRRVEKDRRIPDENIAALEDSGILRMFRPLRYGGSEADTTTKSAVLSELARGCASTAWAATIWVDQNYLVGLFPEQAQDEIFADPDVRVTATINVIDARAVPVEGGYRVSGTFPFNSGSLHAHWAAHAALMLHEDVDPEPALFLIPYSEMTIDDDWDTSGLRGSESNTVRAKDVFVPEHRVLRIGPILAGEIPQNVNDAPLYRISPIHFWNTSISPAALGLARAAAELYQERLPGSSITYTFYGDKAAAPITHMQVAEAALKTQAAQALGDDLTAFVDAQAAAAAPFSMEDRARLRATVGFATRLCAEAVEVLRSGSGASSIKLDVPIQRVARDMQAIAQHAMGSSTSTAELYGRVLCGLEPNSAFL